MLFNFVSIPYQNKATVSVIYNTSFSVCVCVCVCVCLSVFNSPYIITKQIQTTNPKSNFYPKNLTLVLLCTGPVHPCTGPEGLLLRYA